VAALVVCPCAQVTCYVDDDCPDGTVCANADQEPSKYGGKCVPEDPSCSATHGNLPTCCAIADTNDNHCNGKGHWTHGNGYGYGHCKHHQK
jgi:hypothetical protein